jgi:hypothetical protein
LANGVPVSDLKKICNSVLSWYTVITT